MHEHLAVVAALFACEIWLLVLATRGQPWPHALLMIVIVTAASILCAHFAVRG